MVAGHRPIHPARLRSAPVTFLVEDVQRRSSAARSLRSRACRAYAQVSRKVLRNWPSPATSATLTAPDHRSGHQAGRRGRRDHVGDVPDEEAGGRGNDEPAVAAAHLLEGGAALHFQIDVGRAAARPGLRRAGRGSGRAEPRAVHSPQPTASASYQGSSSRIVRHRALRACPPNSPCPLPYWPRATRMCGMDVFRTGFPVLFTPTGDGAKSTGVPGRRRARRSGVDARAVQRRRRVDDELLARRHLVAHQQVEDLLGGVAASPMLIRRSVRCRGSIVVSASWSASISPRPL